MINLDEIRNKIFQKEYLYPLVITFIAFFSDRYSKLEIINNFSENTFFLNDFINLDLVWNTGIGFGLFTTTESFYYNVISSLIGIVILILIYVIFKSDKFDKFVFSLVVGGALGNFYDRLIFKGVPDFIDLHYGNFHWFTFNLADIFISLGIIAFIAKEFFINKER